MKGKKHRRCKKDINRLRNELHKLIESDNLTSSIVQQKSQELDKLITLYFCQKEKT